MSFANWANRLTWCKRTGNVNTSPGRTIRDVIDADLAELEVKIAALRAEKQALGKITSVLDMAEADLPKHFYY